MLARVLAPTTEQLIARAGPLKGTKVVDAACGGGDVTFALARHVGPEGHVTGIDLDEEKLKATACMRPGSRVSRMSAFEVADVSKPWPVKDVDLVYARFILTHLAEPQALLGQVMAALKPGGMILVEDIDIAGRFSYPECPGAHGMCSNSIWRCRGGVAATPSSGGGLVCSLEKPGSTR